MNSRLREFQFKLVHGIIYTNHHLFRFGLVPSNLCSFCDKEEETYKHLFYSCQHVQLIWDSCKKLLDYIDLRNCTWEEVLFGKEDINKGKYLKQNKNMGVKINQTQISKLFLRSSDVYCKLCIAIFISSNSVTSQNNWGFGHNVIYMPTYESKTKVSRLCDGAELARLPLLLYDVKPFLFQYRIV